MLLKISGVEGFTSKEDQESFDRVEKQLKRRFQVQFNFNYFDKINYVKVGTYVSEHLIIDEFSKQSYPEALVRRVKFLTSFVLTKFCYFIGN